MSNPLIRLCRKLRRPSKGRIVPAPGGGLYQRNRPAGLTLIKDSPLNDVDAEGWTRTFGGGFQTIDPEAPFGPLVYEQRFNAGHDGGGAGGQLELALPVLTTMYFATNVKFSANYITHFNQEKLCYPIVGPDSNEHPPYPLNIYRRDGVSGPLGEIGQSYRRSPQGDQRKELDGVTPVRDQFSFNQTSDAAHIVKGQYRELEILYEGTSTVAAPNPQAGPYPHRLRCWINNVNVVDDMVAAWWNGSDLGFRTFRLDDTRGGGPDIENGPIPAQQSRFFSGAAIYGIPAA